MCLERIPCSDDDIGLKMHLNQVHYAKVHLIRLVEMCKAQYREERERWSLDNILEEVKETKEDEKRKRSRAKSGGFFGFIGRKDIMSGCLSNDAEAETNEVHCYLCQEQMKGCGYRRHLRNQHGVLFGMKEIMKSGGEITNKIYNNSSSAEEPRLRGENEEVEIFKTDADTVSEIVEMKYFHKKRKIRLRTPSQKIFSRKYKILNEEEGKYSVSILIYLPIKYFRTWIMNLCSLFIFT